MNQCSRIFVKGHFLNGHILAEFSIRLKICCLDAIILRQRRCCYGDFLLPDRQNVGIVFYNVIVQLFSAFYIDSIFTNIFAVRAGRVFSAFSRFCAFFGLIFVCCFRNNDIAAFKLQLQQSLDSLICVSLCKTFQLHRELRIVVTVCLSLPFCSYFQSRLIDAQCSGGSCINVIKLIRNIFALGVEDLKLGDRVHSLLIPAGRYVCNSTVSLCSPSETVRQFTCNCEVVVLSLCQRCTVIDLASVAGYNRNQCAVLSNRQCAVFNSDVIVFGYVDRFLAFSGGGSDHYVFLRRDISGIFTNCSALRAEGHVVVVVGQ